MTPLKKSPKNGIAIRTALPSAVATTILILANSAHAGVDPNTIQESFALFRDHFSGLKTATIGDELKTALRAKGLHLISEDSKTEGGPEIKIRFASGIRADFENKHVMLNVSYFCGVTDSALESKMSEVAEQLLARGYRPSYGMSDDWSIPELNPLAGKLRCFQFEFYSTKDNNDTYYTSLSGKDPYNALHSANENAEISLDPAFTSDEVLIPAPSVEDFNAMYMRHTYAIKPMEPARRDSLRVIEMIQSAKSDKSEVAERLGLRLIQTLQSLRQNPRSLLHSSNPKMSPKIMAILEKIKLIAELRQNGAPMEEVKNQVEDPTAFNSDEVNTLRETLDQWIAATLLDGMQLPPKPESKKRLIQMLEKAHTPSLDELKPREKWACFLINPDKGLSLQLSTVTFKKAAGYPILQRVKRSDGTGFTFTQEGLIGDNEGDSIRQLQGYNGDVLRATDEGELIGEQIGSRTITVAGRFTKDGIPVPTLNSNNLNIEDSITRGHDFVHYNFVRCVPAQ